MKQVLTALIAFAFILVTSHAVLATDYSGVELVVQDGKKSKETDVAFKLTESGMEILPKKKEFQQHAKSFKYSDIKVADYSFSKKPMLSGGGAVATALLVGFIFALPFLFIKKKNHWLSIQTDNGFAVLKLDGSNYRAILADLGSHGVKVTEVKEEETKKKKKDK
jgi:hypothetical protein